MRLISHSLLKLSLATVTTVAVLTSLPSKVMALGFTGDYDPTKWNAVSNTNANGSVDTTYAAITHPDDATLNYSIALTGGNNNSNTEGTTDWTIAITPARAGTLSFTWSYGTVDDPNNDSAGYLYNSIFTSLASSDGASSSSPVILSLNSGDTFGFRVATTTNDGGAGVLTVSNFNVQPVPFEFDATAGVLTLGAIWGANQWRKNRLKK